MTGLNAIGKRGSHVRTWGLGMLVLLFAGCAVHLLGLWQHVAAQLAGPQANDRQISLVVTQLLQGEHLSRHPLDKEMSKRALHLFLKQLDPLKIYFNQADITEFEKHQNDLDDMVKRGDVRLAHEIFNIYLTRMHERIQLVEKLLVETHDFTVDEEMISDADLAKYAKDEAEVRERWRKRVKFELLVLRNSEKKEPAKKDEGKKDETKSDEAKKDEAKKDEPKNPPAKKESPVERLTRRYHSLERRMKQTTGDELLEWFLTSVTSSFDPHTNYMSPSSYDNFLIQMRLSLDGIGAALQMDDGYVVVSKIIPGGAAAKHAKLKKDDRIVSVGQGDEGPMLDISEMKLNDVVDKIRGRAGTVVRLGVMPVDGGPTQIYAITRQKIELKDSEARGVIFDEPVKKASGQNYKVGVINLPSFYMDMGGAKRGNEDFKSTTRDVRRILDDFKTKGVDLVILDLRYNGGGSLTEAINLTGLFIDNGPVVQVKDSDGKVQHYDDLEPGMSWEGPLVIVTSKFSASASEILAGAIQDYHRGLIVGDTATHGKGTVQSMLELGSQLFRIPNPPNLGALKITMQQFYRPSGDSTQKRGVVADIALPSITTHMDVSESDLEYSLDFDRVPAARFRTVEMVAPDLLPKLRDTSKVRTEKSTDFQKLARRIERYKQQKQRKTVTLNEKKFQDERKELDADKEDEKQLEDQLRGTDEVVKRDAYFNEVISIGIDYSEALSRAKVAKAN